MLKPPSFVARPRAKRPEGAIPFNKFPGGLNTSVPASMITKEELAECINFKYNERGDLEIRPAITKYTSTACDAGVVDIEHAVIDGTNRTIISDKDYKIYYIGVNEVSTEIATVTGEASLLSYNDICFVFDGSYVKYLDSVTAVKIAYDTGKYQVNNYNGEDVAGIKIGDGTNIRAAVKFTSLAHDTGYTIPPVEMDVFLKKVEAGSLSGTITGVVRRASDNVVMATKVFSEDAGDISTDGNFYSVTFDTVANELVPNTDYYASVEFSNGDASNYLELRCSDDSSAGYHYTSSWTADTDHNPIIRLSPGLPPKASYGCISDNRPFLWGDVDNPGYSHYGKLTHLEWGYISAVDNNRNSYEIGAMGDLYGDLWAYGAEKQPYLSALVGDTESDWVLKKKFQAAWSLPKTIVNTTNDLFTGSGDGVTALTGVQEYGDVRTFSSSNKIKDRIDAKFNSEAFAGYYPKDGQYWLYLPGYSRILICHTKAAGHPWTEYLLPITPTVFKQAGGVFLIGCDDGYLYTLDSEEIRDLETTQILPEFKTAYIELPFNADLTKVQFIARSLSGAVFDLDVFKNGADTDSVHTYSYSLTLSDTRTIDDLTMAIEDMNFSFTASQTVPWIELNINCWSFQVLISNVETSGDPVYFSGMFLKYRQLED